MWEERKSGLFVPEGLVREHFSLADWDFHASLTYALDNSIYVSAPSSVKMGGPQVVARYPVLCRVSATLNLPQGRIESQWRRMDSNGPALFLRQQSVLGAFDVNNTYSIPVFTDTAVRVYKYVAGAETLIGSWARSHTFNTWYRERWTWWKEGASLAFRYEYWNGSAWVIVTPDVFDNAPSFEGSATNRCGVGTQAATANWATAWFDDTIIEWP